MALKLKPLGDRLIIEPNEEDDSKSSGGIIIPDTAKEKPQKGEIVAVGPGDAENKMTLKVGDKVLYGKYSGTEINFEDNDYLIMKESDVLAII